MDAARWRRLSHVAQHLIAGADGEVEVSKAVKWAALRPTPGAPTETERMQVAIACCCVAARGLFLPSLIITVCAQALLHARRTSGVGGGLDDALHAVRCRMLRFCLPPRFVLMFVLVWWHGMLVFGVSSAWCPARTACTQAGRPAERAASGGQFGGPLQAADGTIPPAVLESLAEQKRQAAAAEDFGRAGGLRDLIAALTPRPPVTLDDCAPA